MIWGLLLIDLAIVLAGAAWRGAPTDPRLALPFAPAFALPPVIWRWLPAALAASGLLVLGAGLRRRQGPARAVAGRAAAALAIHPALLAWLWFGLSGDGLRPADGAALAVLAAVAAWLLASSRREPGGVGFAKGEIGPAARALWGPTLLMALVPIIWGWVAGARPRPAAVALSLLGYPVYALAQLLVFLALPLPRLRQLGASPPAAAAAVALLFALVHWPNGPLAAASLLAMAVWASVYQRHPSVPALALAMGITATALVQFSPPAALEHARTGPRCVRHRVIAELAAPPAEAPGDTADVAAFVRGLYPALLGRPAAGPEARAWAGAVSTRLRERIAWQFLVSDEHRARHPDRAPPPEVPWTALGEPWRARLASLAAQARADASDGGGRAFLHALYRDLLERTPAEEEIVAWLPALAPDRVQREAVVEFLFDRRRLLARSAADSLTAAALRLP